MLELPLDVRFTRADRRVDADRGAVALERGPLVYCLEAVDNAGQRLDDVVVDVTSPSELDRHEDVLGGVTTISVRGATRPRSANSWWPYVPVGNSEPAADGESITLTAVPYFAWGNREAGAMRVWIPAS